MRYDLFLKLYTETELCDSLEYYIAERGYEDWMDRYSTEEVVDILTRVWDLKGKTIADLRAAMNMSRVEMSQVYKIKLRTLENWEYEASELAPYIKDLIAYTVFNYEEDIPDGVKTQD